MLTMRDGVAGDSLKRIEAARKRYLPSPLRVLFIAEAPPAVRTNRLFYFLDVKDGDTLFLEVMKVLYPREVGFVGGAFKREMSAKRMRESKGELLSKFRADGYYLIDAYPRPMPDGVSSATKARLMRDELPALHSALDELLERKDTPLVLIGGVTYAVCAGPLRSAGWNVANEGMIDHPSQGGRVRFRSKFGSTLARLKETAVIGQQLDSSAELLSDVAIYPDRAVK